MQFSDFGTKMQQAHSVQALMKDMNTVGNGQTPVAMFGGGNPAYIRPVADRFMQLLETLVADKAATETMLGKYDSPQGNQPFIQTVTNFLNRNYDLGITEENVAIAPGSQTGYFLLFNILAGRSGTTKRKILFPLVPEYIGYAEQAIDSDVFTSVRPVINRIGEHKFEYVVDFDSITITDDIAAIALSRPTNPTGNVVSDAEVEQLTRLVRSHDIPLIIDNAYGLPFPDIVVPDTRLAWSDHTVLSMSLSKIGLPSLRIGIFVGPVELMRVFARADGVVSLTSPGFGQFLSRPLLENDEILRLSNQFIRPYYFERAEKTRQLIDTHFPANLPWRLHEYQGSYFFWLWLEGARMTSQQIHDWLKERGVIVVSGDQFFLGQDLDTWQHSHECLRLNFARPDSELERGIPILAEAVRKAYS